MYDLFMKEEEGNGLRKTFEDHIFKVNRKTRKQARAEQIVRRNDI